MNKICTDIEQSRKLLELGVDANTADMHYSTWVILNDGDFILSVNQGQTIEELQKDYGNQIIPAWSLSALLDLMPKYHNLVKSEFRLKLVRNESDKWCCCYEAKFYTMQCNCPIDAAYEMICWLKKDGKICTNTLSI